MIEDNKSAKTNSDLLLLDQWPCYHCWLHDPRPVMMKYLRPMNHSRAMESSCRKSLLIRGFQFESEGTLPSWRSWSMLVCCSLWVYFRIVGWWRSVDWAVLSKPIAAVWWFEWLPVEPLRPLGQCPFRVLPVQSRWQKKTKKKNPRRSIVPNILETCQYRNSFLNERFTRAFTHTREGSVNPPVLSISPEMGLNGNELVSISSSLNWPSSRKGSKLDCIGSLAKRLSNGSSADSIIMTDSESDQSEYLKTKSTIEREKKFLRMIHRPKICEWNTDKYSIDRHHRGRSMIVVRIHAIKQSLSFYL